MEISIKLEVFEGPLDLLLHLIRTLEIDIYDIPIAEITKQYMSYIDTMQTLELDVAGEYLVMAATLMAIKSKMLLPKTEIDVEEEPETAGCDPRDALVAQLLEYRKFKYASKVLKEREEERTLFFTKEPSNLDDYKEEMIPLEPNQLSTMDLFFAFHNMLEKKQKRKIKQTTITNDSETVEETIHYIKEKLKKDTSKKGVSFDSLLEKNNRNELVTTFMALLELMKSGSIKVMQAENYAPIFLYDTEEIINMQE